MDRVEGPGGSAAGAAVPEVWVAVEVTAGQAHECSLEVLGEAERLAKRLGGICAAVLLGENVSRLAGTTAQYGARRVYLVEHPLLGTYSCDAFTMALTDLVRRSSPRLVILAATPYGRELAPRLAYSLSAPLVTECTRLDFGEKGELVATRPAYGDWVYTTVRSTAPPPYLASIRPGAIGLGQPGRSRQAEVVTVTVDLSSCEARTRVMERIPPDPLTVDVSDASLVVAGGRGVGNAENWGLLEDLASTLGAAMAGSRVAMDAGRIPHERMVGQSGKFVAARLYLAVGISGASKHVAGIKGAKAIVAINNDRSASIFSLADLGLVGDAREVLPAITKLAKESGIGGAPVPQVEVRTGP